MKSWFLIPVLSVALLVPARADDLNARAAQIKSQLQTTWLPAWSKTSPANESAVDAAQTLQTLSHAHRLGYSTPDLNLLTAAQVHYKLLRDSRRDKTGDGFYSTSLTAKYPLKSTELQGQVISGLVEYARASGEAEPRGLAIKIWRLIRDQGRDKINGGYYDSFKSGPLGPTEASGVGDKSAPTHLALLEAATELFDLTHDRSIQRDLVELLDLNEGRFFPARIETAGYKFTSNWQPSPTDSTTPSASPALWSEAASAIARAQTVLGIPIRWVDFSRRANVATPNGSNSAVGENIATLTTLALNIPSNRERRAAQLDAALDQLNTTSPQISLGNGTALLDFVAAFGA